MGERREGDKASEGNDEEKTDYNFFTQPHSKELDFFLNFHPKQDVPKSINAHKTFHRKDGSNRKWLTYCKESHSLYCSVCLAFSKSSYTSAFVKDGMNTWSHMYLRIEEHERSATHRESANAYFLGASKCQHTKSKSEKGVGC